MGTTRSGAWGTYTSAGFESLEKKNSVKSRQADTAHPSTLQMFSGGSSMTSFHGEDLVAAWCHLELTDPSVVFQCSKHYSP